MSIAFRGRFIAALKELLGQQIDKVFVNALYKHNWVVYAKRPFTGPQSVIEYLGRYTHKIAISNHRIKKCEADTITFSYKDYKHRSVKKEMTLDAFEFIRRFSMHILPKGFVRIRHYGILSSTSKQAAAIIIKGQLPEAPEPAVTRSAPQPYHPNECPCCRKETMQTIMRFNRRGPPGDWQQLAKDLLGCIITNEEIKKEAA